MYAEYPMIRFMEANGYDVSYMSGLDVATKGPLLLNHKSFLSVGHDEYWSADQRANVEAARDAGVNLAFFSGNEVFWKTRWEPSADGTSTPDRTLVSYKDTHFNAPTDPVAWTGTWRDPRFGTATGGGNPENALTGQFFMVNSGTTDIDVPSAFSKLRLWRDTAIAGVATGATATLGAGSGPWATSGTSTRTTDSALPARSAVCNRQHFGGSLHRLRLHRRPASRDPQPHDLQGPQRRPGLRRRNRAVVLGSGRLHHRQSRGQKHAAGHRQSPCRHGRAARNAHGRA